MNGSTFGGERAVPFDLGVAWSPGAPCPQVLSSGTRTYVAFYLDVPEPEWDGTWVRVIDPSSDDCSHLAVVEFSSCAAVRMGPPNEEVLSNHPLWDRGITGYGGYVVEGSAWLRDLIAINQAHPQFDARRWVALRHFLLVFHDETVEAIATDVDVETSFESMPTLLSRIVARLQ